MRMSEGSCPPASGTDASGGGRWKEQGAGKSSKGSCAVVLAFCFLERAETDTPCNT